MTTKLYLLGTPRLETPDKTALLERKTAAVLAYLALEGATLKYKLAGWLWPDSGEATARNNMRQLLRRFRLAGADVVTGSERLELRAELEVDLKRLSFLETPSLELLRQAAELLEGFDYDDAPDFAEWLNGAREELRELRARSADLEASRSEKVGNYKGALDYAAARLSADPFSEAAYRQLARLHYLLGDRGAALATLERCRKVLETLGGEPLPETDELRGLIQRGEALLGAARPSKVGTLPTAVLRPPVLAGREREWARMEEAWQARKILMVTGEPGMGKTRLVEEFAASKGATYRIDGRPGDTNIPYASQARALRGLLARKPELTPRSGHLKPWVWQELARLLPELGDTPPIIPSATEGAGRLRFFEAMGLAFAYCTRDLQTLIVDDLQFYDDYTMEIVTYYQNQSYAQAPGMPPHITVFRKGELSEDKQAIANQFVEVGLAVLIDLEPLLGDAVGTLLEGLGLHETNHLVPGLTRYTGGNPLFVLETLKHLIETDTLALGLPSRLAPPGKVATLMTRRLQRLSPEAFNLARTVAIAGTAFNMRLAAHVLERPGMELAEAHAELEATQVLRGNAFTHDLVFETVLMGIPAAVEQVLNSRTASYLETVKADPAVIALHWLEGGEPLKAAPQLLAASESAQMRFQVEEAARLREQAVDVYEAHGDTAAAFEALFFLHRDLQTFDYGARFERATARLFQLATTPRQRAKAHLAQASYLVDNLWADKGEAAAREGLRLLPEDNDFLLRAQLSNELALALGQQGRHQEALALIEKLRPELDLPANRVAKMFILDAYISLLLDTGRYGESLDLAREAEVGWLELGNPVYGVSFIIRRARCLGYVGLTEEALGSLDEAEAWMAERGVVPTIQNWADLWRGLFFTDTGRYAQALDALERALHATGGMDVTRAQACCGLARLLRLLGAPDRAGEALRALETRLLLPETALRCRLEEAGLVALQDPGGALALLEAPPTPHENPFYTGLWQLAKATLVTPEVGLPLAQEALQRAHAHGMNGLEIAAHTRLAEAHLALRETEAARTHSERAVTSLASYTPPIYRSEVLWTHYRVLEAARDPKAIEALRTLVAWLMEVADNEVPSAYRESFLMNNPVNRAVLGAAQSAGLEVPSP